MKILKLQDFFNGSFEGITFIRQSLNVVACGANIKCQRVYLQHNSLQIWRIS